MTGLARWRPTIKLEVVLEDSASVARTAFMSSLSAAQQASLAIIQEWWTLSIEHEPWFRQNPDKAQHAQVLDMYTILEHAPPHVARMVLNLGP